MTSSISERFSPVLSVVNNQAVTTSKEVARVFEKRHDNIVRDIETLEIPDGLRSLNFEESSIETQMPRGGVRKIKTYTMTKDGFVLLAMGFTGAKAMKFKLAYIDAFNQMERKLREQSTPAVFPFDEPAMVVRMFDQIMARIESASQSKPKEQSSCGGFSDVLHQVLDDIDDVTIARTLWKIFHGLSLTFIGRVADIERDQNITDTVGVGMDEIFARIERLEIQKFGRAQE